MSAESRRVVVDPVTRIEGHLRIEVATDADRRITQAYSSGTMVRGLEIILRGRDPRDAWAFAQRICGVCTLVHGIASVRAVEDALRWEIPQNANLVRNLMIGAQYVHDHVMHFYHLHALDWVDVVSALQADPKATSTLAQSISSYARSSPGYFADVQQRVKGLVESGQLGIFANGYWGHPAYKLPPEANLMAVAHYLDALAWQRDVARLHAIFGGKNPHPHFVVGGAPNPIDLESDSAINAKRLSQVQDIIVRMREFVDEVYVPDTLAIAGFYKDWATQGEGLGNFLCFGDFPAQVDLRNRRLPGAARRHPESRPVAHRGGRPPRPGADRGVREPRVLRLRRRQGPRPASVSRARRRSTTRARRRPIRSSTSRRGYSWMKSPRWRGKAMEVGPLARMLMLVATGHDQAKELVDQTLTTLQLPLAGLYSTLGRTAARTLETKIFADAMQGWYDQLVANIKAGDTQTFDDRYWDPATWPAQARGAGFMEAPRGALGHWIVIENGRIDNYQAVVPSTWNAGPRDATGQPGAYEAALAGHVLHDPDQPLEILRTIHSFDPCIACAVHVLDPDGGDALSVRVT